MEIRQESIICIGGVFRFGSVPGGIEFRMNPPEKTKSGSVFHSNIIIGYFSADY
jgi:hypothetical protein